MTDAPKVVAAETKAAAAPHDMNPEVAGPAAAAPVAQPAVAKK